MSEQRKPRPATLPPLPQGKGMDWDKLRVFHAVAEAGSFTHAGEALNLSQSAVSRQISALEESLSVPLFHRHARGLILTEQGDLLYRTAREVFAKLAMTEAMLSESKDRPRGPLKVTTTVAFGSGWLVPRIREFLELYPEIQLSVVVDDSELDLSMREADVAIRMSAPRQPDLVQRHLLTVRYHIYAAPEYLKKYGVPQKALGSGRPTGLRAAADPLGQQHARDIPRGRKRTRDRRIARLHGARSRRSRARVAGSRGPGGGGLFRLPRGTPEFQAHCGVSRFPVAESRRVAKRLSQAWPFGPAARSNIVSRHVE